MIVETDIFVTINADTNRKKCPPDVEVNEKSVDLSFKHCPGSPFDEKSAAGRSVPSMVLSMFISVASVVIAFMWSIKY